MKERDKENTQKRKEENKVFELTELLQRVQADFENYRKQVERRAGELREMAAQDFILQLLPIIDDFELALKNTELKNTEPQKQEEKGGEKQKDFVRGVELIHSRIASLLKDNGVKKMETTGKSFDPYFHEALIKVESEEPENTILEEFQKGFTLHGRVLRHARVKVSAGKKENNTQTEEEKNGN